MHRKFTTALAAVALLILSAGCAHVQAAPLTPGSYLPLDAEMPDGYVLTMNTGTRLRETDNAYEEQRVYERLAPTATVITAAGISPDITAAHDRFTRKVDSYVLSGYTQQSSSQGDESRLLWQAGAGGTDDFILIWRADALVGMILYHCPPNSIGGQDVGYQLGLVARPMLDRMHARHN